MTSRRHAPAEPLPLGIDDRSLRRRALWALAVLGVVALVAAFGPGLGDLRDRLGDAQPAWLALAVLFELLSCLSYVLMFRAVFCPRMTWRTSYRIGMSELAIGSLVPASGLAGLAFGAWVLRRGGTPGEEIARRTVAFFVLKSSVNFAAVAVVGVAMWLGAGPAQPIALTLLPAVLAASAMAAVAALPWVISRRGWQHRATDALGEGVRTASRALKDGDWRIVTGSIGYWAFDNAVLWAALTSFGASPPLTVVLMGYLIGQLGGLLPIPGGLGGIDGGLLGALVVYGLSPLTAGAAILAYRLILFWLPLVLGGAAFVGLRRALQSPGSVSGGAVRPTRQSARATRPGGTPAS